MSLTAKPIVKNKFWIVEKDGEKVATIQRNTQGVVYVHNNERKLFDNIKNLEKTYNISFDTKVQTKPKAVVTEDISGYPTAHRPHNILKDIKHKSFIYTKSAKSKSYFCAGYYIIEFSNNWMPSFCPKLITLQRYKFQGPFKSKLEQQEHLRLANTKDVI